MQVYWAGLGKRVRRFFSSPAESLGAIQPELPRMAVVPYSSDVLCVHKSRLQLLYIDVQQLKMVQMVSQPPMILRLVSIWPDAFTRLPEKCAKFCCLENFAQEEGNRLKYL